MKKILVTVLLCVMLCACARSGIRITERTTATGDYEMVLDLSNTAMKGTTLENGTNTFEYKGEGFSLTAGNASEGLDGGDLSELYSAIVKLGLQALGSAFGPSVETIAPAVPDIVLGN